MTDTRPVDLIPLRELVDDLPKSRDGMAYDPSTIRRWALYGIEGIKLASVKVAGRRYSSREALRHFLEQCAGR